MSDFALTCTEITNPAFVKSELRPFLHTFAETWKADVDAERIAGAEIDVSENLYRTNREAWAANLEIYRPRREEVRTEKLRAITDAMVEKLTSSLPVCAEIRYHERDKAAFAALTERLKKDGWESALAPKAAGAPGAPSSLLDPLPGQAFLTLDMDFAFGAGGRDEPRANYHHAKWILLRNREQLDHLMRSTIDANAASPARPAEPAVA